MNMTFIQGADKCVDECLLGKRSLISSVFALTELQTATVNEQMPASVIERTRTWCLI